mmetsp:Transcript_40972/g.122333  ORF Transcript_40972/g.122333 Transcript_40972/m.122333 type:complete len:229 (+) Transcript_40972:663-1349(+)
MLRAAALHRPCDARAARRARRRDRGCCAAAVAGRVRQLRRAVCAQPGAAGGCGGRRRAAAWPPDRAVDAEIQLKRRRKVPQDGGPRPGRPRSDGRRGARLAAAGDAASGRLWQLRCAVDPRYHQRARARRRRRRDPAAPQHAARDAARQAHPAAHRRGREGLTASACVDNALPAPFPLGSLAEAGGEQAEPRILRGVVARLGRAEGTAVPQSRSRPSHQPLSTTTFSS